MGLIKRTTAILAVFGLAFGMLIPAFGQAEVYGGTWNLSFDRFGAESVMQGDKEQLIGFTVTNRQNQDFSYTKATLDIEGGGITGSDKSEGAIKADSSADIVFSINVSRTASTGTRFMSLKLTDENGVVTESSAEKIEITEFLAAPGQGGGATIATADITHSITPAGGFSVGDGNTLKFNIFNNGNTLIKDAVATLTLPDSMAVYNSSNSYNMGYLSTGSKKTVSFPITVVDTAESKNYAITLKLSGRDFSNQAVTVEKTFYIPVLGGNATSSTKDMAIQGISMPGSVTADQDFTMSFNVKNTGSTTAKNMKVFLEMPEGLLNKTTTTFVENSFAPGETKSYSVKMFSNTGGKTYPVKIAVDPLSGTGGNTMQYVSVFVEGGSGNAKTPILMVDKYSYGGASVKARSTFVLNLGLYNTSGKTITNAKISLTSEDGTFVPVGGSNSFFVESIPSKGHFTKAVELSVKPQAEQKTSAINVALSYEDGAGGAYTSTDIISIPVTQDTRLVVDDIVPPYEVYVGQPGSCEVSFYNMGKTQLSNVRVTAEGDFDVMQSNSYYGGNMDSGKSDSYSFTFIPRQAGPMEGKLIFTYEDANGEAQAYETAFVFEAMEMPVFEDPGMIPEEQKPKPWGLIIGGSIVVLLAAGAVIFLKLRKRKLHKSLELADEAFMAGMDIKDDGDVPIDGSPVDEGNNKDKKKKKWRKSGE